MKKSSYITASILAGALILGAHLTSCEHYVLPDMTVTPDTLIFNAAGGVQTVTVKSNVIWNFDVNQNDDNYVEWITCDPDWGPEGCESVITVTENTGRLRQLTIPVKTETIRRNLVIIQEGTEL